MRHHRTALAYDVRVRFGWRVAEIESRLIPWSEAWEVVSEILRDPWSHSCSSMRGDTYVPHPIEPSMADLIEVYANSKRGKGQIATKVPRPWVGKPTAEARTRTPRNLEQTARRRSALNKRLGLD